MQLADPVVVSTMTGPPLTSTAGDRIDEIVWHWADTTPDAVAVRCAGASLTYRQLVNIADRIAQSLAGRGIGGADIVGVQLPRGIDLVCVLLGVLRAGAVYTVLPLDWPAERRREALRLTDARACVTDLADRLDGLCPMLTVDALLGDGNSEQSSHIHAAAAPQGELGDVSGGCCVFFTSGSTGTPKGALAPHRGVIRVALDPVAGLGQHTVMLQSSAMAWDLFAIELWGPLLNGGTSVLRDSDFFSYDDLRHAVADGVNTVFLTPTIFNGAVTEDIDCLAGVHTVFVGGDRPSGPHVERFLARFPRARVFNIYGPVEATIWVTRHLIEPGRDTSADVPIGTPVPWTGIHLIDGDNLVGAGEVGEIAVSGDGVSYGYLGNPQETARRFRELPVGPDGQLVRAYLTGDYGSIDERGILHFHGRKDRQVKIQGVRVEPSEVERVVAELPSVSAVVAVPIPVGGPPESLAVVYAAGEIDGPHPDQVRAAVADALPRAFVPRVVRRIDAVPLNANGKVDQHAIAGLLSEVDGASRRRTRSAITTVLVELEDLTGSAVSLASDVVELGLTSITGLKLVGRLRVAHGVRMPMREIFRRRTPLAIAEWIDQHSADIPSATAEAEKR